MTRSHVAQPERRANAEGFNEDRQLDRDPPGADALPMDVRLTDSRNSNHTYTSDK